MQKLQETHENIFSALCAYKLLYIINHKNYKATVTALFAYKSLHRKNKYSCHSFICIQTSVYKKTKNYETVDTALFAYKLVCIKN